LLLLAGIAAYTVFAIRLARRTSPQPPVQGGGMAASGTVAGSAGWIAAGLGTVIVGGHWLVSSAAEAARALGVSETVIGLTIVAAGTSMPELVTSLIATLRGEREIAIGNVIGSNIYNILAILGLSGVISGTGLAVNSGMLSFDIPVLIASAVACLPLFFTGHTVARWEGALLLGYYGLYVAYLVIHATDHPALSSFATAVWSYLIPLSAITLVVTVYRHLRLTHRSRAEGGC
jgi:cation:H+ antiporter